MLSSGSRNHFCSPPAILLWSWVFTVLVYWGPISLPCPVSLSAGPLLSTCFGGLLIVFQFCSVVCLWILLTGSGDELSVLLPALFQPVTYHWPAVGPFAFIAIFY
jgi:hypothetical protein